MSRVLITGGGGLIGSRLARLLTAQNHVVLVADRFQPPPDCEPASHAYYLAWRLRELPAGMTCETVDLCDAHEVGECLTRFQPEYVVHLAALADAAACEKHSGQARADNVDGTSNLLKGLQPTFTRRVLFVSSSYVYGDFHCEPADEDHPCRPEGVYGETKWVGEQLTREQCRCKDMEYVIIRPSAVYGYGDVHPRVVNSFMSNACSGRALLVMQGGRQQLDFSYVEDVATGLALALFADSARNEIFNLTRGEARSVLQLARAVQTHFPESRVVITEERDEVHRPVRGALDIRKARRLLGYEPRFSLEEGIAAYAADLRAEGLPKATRRAS